MTATHTVTIDLPPRQGDNYDILIGTGLLGEAGALIAARLGMRRCVIITDSKVGPLYRVQLEAALKAAGHTLLTAITVPAGEASKDFATLQSVLERMLAAGIDRRTLVIALGGGVVGDLAGVAAALALRGVDVVQIPTTLLAQVDSSVGGKTGIDTAHGKNTVGAFYQPRLVIADTATLASLPVRHLKAGYAETVKYGLIGDRGFFEWCEQNGAAVIAGDRAALTYAIETSCRAKAEVVAADERETGNRALLNLGHTFGHALETALGYSDALLHGEAVAVGTVLAFRLSARLGHCSVDDADRVVAHFKNVGLPIAPPPHQFDIAQLMQFMAQDKKAEAGRLTLVLARGIGEAFVSRDVDATQVEAVWREMLD